MKNNLNKSFASYIIEFNILINLSFRK